MRLAGEIKDCVAEVCNPITAVSCLPFVGSKGPPST